MEMFSGAPPPLAPVLDAVGIWNADDLRKIEAAREPLRLRFPQFHWCVCSVCLGPETSLPLFGFWLLNACPLAEHETAEHRTWTVLLLIDVKSGQAAAIPGYAAEPWLSDGDWRKILAEMAPNWRVRDTAGAVAGYFANCANFLEATWQRRNGRRSRR
jgi:hypothetical protein